MSTEDSDATKNSKSASRFSRFAGAVLTRSSPLLAIALIAIHWLQIDYLAPITLIPPWMWLVPVGLLFAFTFRKISRRMLVGTLAAWILFTALFAEEASSLLRFRSQSTSLTANGIVRVVTLNINIGSLDAAKETQRFKPDIVLFQESFGEQRLQELSERFFGQKAGHLHGGDVSIMANGTVTPIHVDRASHFVHALVSIDGGKEFDVVCLRLSAPVFRIDCWSSGFWGDHEKVRKKHRQQIKEVVDHLQQSAKTRNWIVGGDFNLVGNDGSLSPMATPLLTDTFNQSGSGWCNTGTSNYPLFRVDQIWISESLKSRSTKAYQCKNSDHRMVVSDLTDRE